MFLNWQDGLPLFGGKLKHLYFSQKIITDNSENFYLLPVLRP